MINPAKLGEYYKCIPLDIYRREVHLIINPHMEKCNKHLYSDFSEDMDNSNAISCMSTDPNYRGRKFIILSTDTLYISTIAHEALHIAKDLFESIREDNPSDEAYSYLLGYIVGEIVKCIQSNNLEFCLEENIK